VKLFYICKNADIITQFAKLVHYLVEILYSVSHLASILSTVIVVYLLTYTAARA
jgi:hypothetical protein